MFSIITTGVGVGAVAVVLIDTVLQFIKSMLL
jgi:hypothetical protein